MTNDHTQNDRHNLGNGVLSRVYLAPAAVATILEDITQRSQVEACGLLIGTLSPTDDWLVESAHPMTNIQNSPIIFEFDPFELLEQSLQRDAQIMGVYHSHPHGPAAPSQTDLDTMEDWQERNWVWTIWSGLPGVPADSTPTSQTASARRTIILGYRHYPELGLQRIEVVELPR